MQVSVTQKKRPVSASPVMAPQVPASLLDMSEFDDRLDAVQAELAALRSQYPDLDRHFAATKPPPWGAPPASNPTSEATEPPLPTGPAHFTLRSGGYHRRTGPGSYPPGYRMLSKYQSTPAFSFRQKIVLSRNVDPTVADDTPGPGACVSSLPGLSTQPALVAQQWSPPLSTCLARTRSPSTSSSHPHLTLLHRRHFEVLIRGCRQRRGGGRGGGRAGGG